MRYSFLWRQLVNITQIFSADEIIELKRKMLDDEIFNPHEATVYLLYLDANNLYGWAMSQPLPIRIAEWLDKDESDSISDDINNAPPSFIEVDLEYPIELHDYFSELVPAPDSYTSEGSKVPKLAPNLLSKKGYVGHYKNLKLWNKLGVKITRVVKGLKFDEEPGWNHTLI